MDGEITYNIAAAGRQATSKLEANREEVLSDQSGGGLAQAGAPYGCVGEIAPNLGCISGARVTQWRYLLPAHGLAESNG